MEPIALGLVIAAALTMCAAFAYSIRGITFEGVGSDQEVHARAAAESHRWRWPSDMHKTLGQKARMKDMGILMVAFMQRLLHNRSTMYPLSLGCALAHGATGVLVFLVASSYWSVGVGVLLSALYLPSFWAYMVILNGAYQGLAVMFLLLSIYFLQLADPSGATASGAWYAAAGGAFGAMLFSSASSRKLIPLVLAAFLVNQYSQATSISFQLLLPTSTFDWSIFTVGAAAVSLLFLLLVADTAYVAVGHSRFHTWIGTVISRHTPYMADHIERYTVHFARRHAPRFILLGFSIVLFLVITALLFGSNEFFVAILSALGGTLLVIFLLTFPNLFRNLMGYYIYYIQVQYFGHYQLYDDYFQARLGGTLREGAGGLLWYPRFFQRMLPFHAVFYIAAVVYLAYSAAVADTIGGTAGVLAVVLLSATPLLWCQATRCPKAALPYFPTFVGLFLAMGYAADLVLESLSSSNQLWFWVPVSVLVLASALWNFRVFSLDILPSRMAISLLDRKLSALKVKSFFTYDTPYNNSLVTALSSQQPSQYEIRFIDTLKEVTHGHVVVPGLSAKAMSMEGSGWAIKNGDFKSDVELTYLIETKAIERYAVTSLKTFGSSPYWVQNYDVPSFRDLILKEIGDEDRWRGRAWILDGAKLHAARVAGSLPLSRPAPSSNATK